FSDESERANVMLVAVVMVPPAAVEPARVALRGLLLAGQRRIHTSDESTRRRRVALDTVAGLDALSAVVLRHRRAQGVARGASRHLLLQAATGLVVGSGVTAWTLDDQDPATRARDRASIARALAGVEGGLHPSYDHRPSHAEPLLWAADAIAWAVGAGGDWRRRVAAVVTIRDIGV
ncbi:MAG TPA: hypothetical protein VE983_07135, partial [Solirubrobacteraceae bacterium]|nr:hypothetical protein [Solirubrobacteraceae bacterium]